MSEYYCPNCGADLEDQSGFDPDDGYWTCKECGKLLIDPDDDDDDSQYSGVRWFCDECGACLNKQSGFEDWYSSWTCTKCGHVNSISEDEIYESEEDYERHKNEDKSTGSFLGDLAVAAVDGVFEGINSFLSGESDDDYDDDDDDDDDGDDIESYYDSIEYKKRLAEQKRIEEEEARRLEEIAQKRKERRKRFWRTVFRRKQTPGISSDQCIGRSYRDLEEALKGREYTNITSINLEDLPYSEIDKDGIVAEIYINNQSVFAADTRFTYNSRIEIEYHGLQRTTPPMTSKKAKRNQVDEVVQAFKDAGFVKVRRQSIPDLKLGWFKKENSVEEIIINGTTNYNAKERFRLDSSIIVSYHSFPRYK